MDVRDLFDDVVTKAKEFGLIAKNEGRNVVDPIAEIMVGAVPRTEDDYGPIFP